MCSRQKPGVVQNARELPPLAAGEPALLAQLALRRRERLLPRLARAGRQLDELLARGLAQLADEPDALLARRRRRSRRRPDARRSPARCRPSARPSRRRACRRRRCATRRASRRELRDEGALVGAEPRRLAGARILGRPLGSRGRRNRDVDALVGEHPLEERLRPRLDAERAQRLELALGRRSPRRARPRRAAA